MLFESGEPDARPTQFPSALGPTVRKVADPVLPIEEILEAFGESPGGQRPANTWLQRQAGIVPALKMRPCCAARLQRIDSVLQQLPPTSLHECESCGTVWEVSYVVREDRQHGR